MLNWIIKESSMLLFKKKKLQAKTLVGIYQY